MDDKLYKFMDSLSEDELSEFEDALGKIERSAKIGEREKGRILTSAMRKAGVEMLENKETKRVKFKKKRIIAIAAAAVLLAAGGTVAAVGGASFLNRDSIVHQFGEDAPEQLEELGQAANIVSENEHFRITADTVINDGIYMRVFFTVDALDDTAVDVMGLTEDNQLYIPPWIDYNYEGEEIDDSLRSGTFGSAVLKDTDSFNPSRAYFEIDFPTYKYDTSKRLTANFSTVDFASDGEEYMDGVSITLDLEKNVETVTFAADDGTDIYMSPIGISTDFGIEEGGSTMYISYTMADGTETDQEIAGFFTDTEDNHSHIEFEELTDPDNYQAVKLGFAGQEETVYTRVE